MVERAVLKRNSKDQLRGKWGLAIAAFIISAIIPSIISIIGSVIESDSITTIGMIIAVIVAGPISYGLCTIAVGIGYIILIVPGIILSIMFAQSYFILADNNDLSAIDCIKASCEMMKGNKMYFFILMLSFIGWFILGEITCGIGLLWVMPYYNITLGNFYDELSNKVS